MHKLTSLKVKNTKPESKAKRYSDGGGLYLHVGTNGGRSWVFVTRAGGKRRELGLGSLDVVTLAEAREKAHLLRKQIAQGERPEGKRRRQGRERAAAAKALSFEAFAEQCLRQWQAAWRNPKHRQQWHSTLASYVYPKFGNTEIGAVDARCVHAALSAIWQSHPETASRVRGRIEAVLTAAQAAGLRQGENPAKLKLVAAMLGEQIKSVKHRPALPYSKLPTLYAELANQDGMGALALRFLILTASRSGEVRGAKWSEVNLDEAVWTVPGARMKGRREHRVPLCGEALRILSQVAPLRTSPDALVFPSMRPRAARGSSGNRAALTASALSDMTLSAVLKRMEHTDITVHGFRSTFRDWVGDETDFPREVAEAALGHVVGDKAERAYRRGSAFAKRKNLMTAWCMFVTVG